MTKYRLVEIDPKARYCLEYDGNPPDSLIARMKEQWRRFLEDEKDLLVLTHGARLVRLIDTEEIDDIYCHPDD